jgi:hypothetical protein
MKAEHVVVYSSELPTTFANGIELLNKLSTDEVVITWDALTPCAVASDPKGHLTGGQQ